MEGIFEHLSLGFSVAIQPEHLLFCFIGTLLGTVIGVLPGIGPTATIAMLLPLTFGMPPTAAIIMLAGVYYGSQYGGSTTAILVNVPGESASAVTTIDGYRMALKGRAGPALVAAGLGSFIAGTVATVLVAFLALPMTRISLSFGSAEYFSLIVVGLAFSISLASGSTLKAMGMIVLGLLLGLTGMDIYAAIPRFTFDQLPLLDGLSFAAITVGMYGVGEILRNMAEGTSGASSSVRVGRLWPSRDDLRRIIAPAGRGTAIGSFLGILPGGGALLSSFIAYNLEKRFSRNASEMGHGAIEGVAAPEAANNAGAQTSFIPMLALGIPGNAVMALMLGALVLQGITPGPTVISREPQLFWGLIASMWIGNAMLLILNIPLLPVWVSLLKVPYSVLFPAIIAFCCIGVYSIDNSSYFVYGIIVAGILGYLFVAIGCELAPFILGFILGPMVEEYFRRAMILSDGDPTVFFTRPISAALLVVAIGVIVFVSVPAIAKQRRAVFVEED